jgi:hypothetical protein
MITYNNTDVTIVTKTPTVEFKQCVPTHFINEFIRRMGKGQIRVTDYQGNELKVYYETD